MDEGVDDAAPPNGLILIPSLLFDVVVGAPKIEVDVMVDVPLEMPFGAPKVDPKDEDGDGDSDVTSVSGKWTFLVVLVRPVLVLLPLKLDLVASTPRCARFAAFSCRSFSKGSGDGVDGLLVPIFEPAF